MQQIQMATMSMQKYGSDLSIDVSLGDFASMIYMIGSSIDHGPEMVEIARASVLEAMTEAKKLVESYPELRDQRFFYEGYYLAACALLLAFDAYLEIKPMKLDALAQGQNSGSKEDGAINPNFEKFFH